jgi:uracil-DNA glycosylase family 4
MARTRILEDFGDTVETESLPETSIEVPQPIFTKGKRVPNKFPLIDSQTYRIAIIGEAPGRDEELQGTPFVGMSGKLLTGILTRVGIVREACFIGNIVQYRPPSNDISYWYKYDHSIVEEGLTQLKKDLEEFKPNIVILLGKTALKEAKGIDKITQWRGSLFIGNLGTAFDGLKCISSYHPAFILRNYSWSAYLLFDIAKAKEEASTPMLILPQRNLEINLPCDVLVDKINALNKEQAIKVSCDLEGYWNNLSCISIATSPLHSFIIPFTRLDNSHYWNEEEEFFIWKAFIALMENSKVLKVWQNGLYDRFVLQYGYGIVVLGNVDDTMLKFWERFCEIRRKLSVQASILTKEVYWKHERLKGEDEIEGH